MRGSREISLVPSLHRASTDALIIVAEWPAMCVLTHYSNDSKVLFKASYCFNAWFSALL